MQTHDVDALVRHHLLTRSSLSPPAPILPQDGAISHYKGVHEDTHLARLFRLLTVPLTVLPLRTHVAVCNPGSIHDPSSSICLGTLFLNQQVLAGWATQRPIRQLGEVLACEAPGFPPFCDLGWPIPLWRQKCICFFRGRRGEGRSEFRRMQEARS